VASVHLNGVSIDIAESGAGRPLLFLHPGYPAGRRGEASAAIARLSENFRVIAPTHPGFGRDLAPDWLTTIDDLSYLYLDLLISLGRKDTVVVGSSLGGWIAAEMAVKCTGPISHLVLADPVGIKIGDRETRDFPDIYAIDEKTAVSLSFSDPSRVAYDRATLAEDDFLFMARSREATARYGWAPFLHNPKLLRRLARIQKPTLVLWGEADRITSQAYGAAYAAAIPGAKFAQIPDAGHFPHIEQPGAFAKRIADFVAETAS